MQEEIEGVSFVYEKRIASHLEDKTIDFHEGPQEGFSIRGSCADLGCDSCG